MSADLITRKPTAAMIELLRRGAADKRGVMTLLDPNCRTLDGIFRRDMAETVSETGATHSWVLINKRGRDYLAKLDRPETGPADVADVTDEEIADGVEDALQWLPYGKRDEARAKGAAAVLAVEFKRSGKIWRSLAKQGGRIPVETQALRYYNKVQKLLAAARLREQQQAPQAPVSAPTTTQETTMAETPAPAPQRTGVIRGFTTDADGNHDRTPVLEIDGERYRLVAVRPAGVHEDEGVTLAVSAHSVHISGRYRTGALPGRSGDMPVAWGVDGHTWERVNGYEVRTEDRGHGIIAVYVKGSANDISGIERASRAYARKNLTFAPGRSMGAVGGGGEFHDAGATYISQDVHTTQPLTARTD
ncbi:hypothetical protein [Streptomyces mirabilis]|uniref:hypothetical protein n=1 Tax=Streptomyces mirabilis TaxID=68239 RepID=UPI003686E298